MLTETRHGYASVPAVYVHERCALKLEPKIKKQT